MTRSHAAPQPILNFTYAMSYPDEVNESLNVYSDGSVWYWSLKPAATQLLSRVGTFQFQLPDHEYKDLQELAAELVKLSALDDSPSRNTIAINVTATAGGKSQTHLLSESDAGTVPAAIAQAYRIGEDLMRRAEHAPLAVVRMDWRVVHLPVKAGVADHVKFLFENIGIKPVIIGAKLDSYTLHKVDSRNYSSQIWAGQEGLGTGIMSESEDGSGGLPGGMPEGNGIYAPAIIAPGSKSSAFFRDALLLPEAGKVLIGAAVQGKINIYYPQGASNAQDEQYPTWPYTLSNLPVEIDVAG